MSPKQRSRLVLKGLKNESSIKTIFLTQPLILEIFERLKVIEDNKKTMGDEYHDYGLPICQKNGDPIEPDLLGKRFTKWQKSVDYKYPALSFKGLRHSSTTYKFGLSGGDVLLFRQS